MMFRKSENEWDTLRDLKMGYVSFRRFAPPVDGLLATLALEWWLAPTSSWLNPCFTKDLDLKIVIIYVKAVTWLKQKLLG